MRPGLPDGSPNVEPKTGRQVAVLEWAAWGGFLLPNLLGDTGFRIATDPFRPFPEADFETVCRRAAAVCFHINLSLRRRLPLDIEALTVRFVKRGLHVVNGGALDIRKSVLHAHLEAIGLPSARATKNGAPDEMLFLKTELNYGGELERRLPADLLSETGLGELVSTDLGPYSYRSVCRRDVPESAWADPSLVVEKFVTNPEGSFFRAYFCGRQIIIVKAFAHGAIKKLVDDPRDTNFVSDLEYLRDGSDGLPLSARLKRDVVTFVDRTPADFGCIDIVHDGRDRHFVVDLNLTPYAGSSRRNTNADLNAYLRRGISRTERRKATIDSTGSPLAGATEAVS